jgi:hypothetical protein
MEKHEHTYMPSKYTRDDSGFWLECTVCHEAHCFDCANEEELYELFGLGDDEDLEDWGDPNDDKYFEEDEYCPNCGGEL